MKRARQAAVIAVDANCSSFLLTIIRVCVEMAALKLPPTAMYVCICNGVTDRQVREAAQAGCGSLPELTMRTGLGANCGSCVHLAEAIMVEIRQQQKQLPLPVLSQAA